MKIEITNFILWESKGGFSGYGKYFELRQWNCVIKGRQVFIVEGKKWIPIGKFFPYPEPVKIRGAREYECIGEIWALGHVYHVVRANSHYLAF